MADVSLDDMLLEAAGRPKGSHAQGKPGRGPVKRRGVSNHNSSSDDNSDSKSDNDFDDEDDYGRRGSGRRGEGPNKMPVTIRIDEGSEEAGRPGYESDLSFGSDLYKDDDDRVRLAAMTELEREMILHDRAEARDNFKIRRKASNRHSQMQTSSAKPRERDVGPPSSRMRSSVKESTKSVKQNALHELVARRQRAQGPDFQRRSRDVGASGSRERESRFRSGKSRDRESYSDSESESSDSDESSRDDDDRSDGIASDEDDRRKDDPNAFFKDISSITIRRSKLAKWFMEPFFEDVIVGCFVRIGIGISGSGQSIYRLCLVKNVDARDPDKQYKFENRTTYKYLNCIWGNENSAARWQMIRASDQHPTEKEILDWKREVERVNGRRPSKADIAEKRQAIAKVNSFVYSAVTVKQMLQEKKQATTRPSNIAVEKDRIMQELSLAESKGEHLEIERLQTRLKELEDYTVTKSKDAKALALTEMNKRNKYENFKNASELKPVNTHAKAGEAGYDPFSRRWTRSQNYYKSDPRKEETEPDNSTQEKALVIQNIDQTRVTPMDIKTKLFSLHDFDIPISLAPIQEYGGSEGAQLAYMARKQKLEAKCGAQIDCNDGRRHTLTLTVNDYKRRRGLL